MLLYIIVFEQAQSDSELVMVKITKFTNKPKSAIFISLMCSLFPKYPTFQNVYVLHKTTTKQKQQQKQQQQQQLLKQKQNKIKQQQQHKKQQQKNKQAGHEGPVLLRCKMTIMSHSLAAIVF